MRKNRSRARHGAIVPMTAVCMTGLLAFVALALDLGILMIARNQAQTAADRPRDAVLVVDFSGSMRFDSMLGSPHGGKRTASQNPDTTYPTWGHYNGNSTLITWQADVAISSGEVIGKANTVINTTDAPT